MAIVDPGQHTLIIDSGCDQTLISSVWVVLDWCDRHVEMSGPMAGRNTGEVFPIVSAAAKVTDRNGNCFCAIVHEALYDENPQQTESLLSTHQAKRLPQNRIDDNSLQEFDVHGNPGTQKSVFGPHHLPMFYDGSVCFYQVDHIQDHEFHSLPKVVLTDGGEKYEPKKSRRHTVRTLNRTSTTLEQWQRRLGFAPMNVVKQTLKATTQLVKTVELKQEQSCVIIWLVGCQSSNIVV